ncbi:hypothetical protein [Roseibacillus persicicus]|uniref:hypothetical protein n=1 Tax=Roseibacillus persicicus TaxID=454148 RepID=UPI00280DD8F7|nr:hypothetical protein [Roseibacillus persicicus]MDQ8189151.1 hypothetical protein [Roseibacillus persicicus]
MSGPCPNCHSFIQGPNFYSPPQPQPLNPPVPEEQDFTLPIEDFGAPAPQAQNPPPAQPAPENPSPEEPAPTPTAFTESAPVQPTPSDRAPQQVEPAPLPERLPEPEPEPRPSDAPLFDESEAHPAKANSTNTRSKASLSLLQAFLLCFFSSVAFFILGFFLGKTGAVSWQEILDASKAQQEGGDELADNPSPAGNFAANTDLSPSLPEKKEPETNPNQAEVATARASLEAFLAAGTWTTRSAFVLFPDQILPHMEASAEVHGDGPYQVDSIRLEMDEPDMKVFQLKAPQLPAEFSVILIKVDGHWLVDWEGFADFYHDRLRAFAGGMDGAMKGVFRVLLKPAPGETSPLSPAHCLITTNQNPEIYPITSATDSPARKNLAEIFQSYLQGDRARFEEAMEEDGIPLIIEISRNGASNPTLRLEKIIATTWAPKPPEKSGQGDSSSFY